MLGYSNIPEFWKKPVYKVEGMDFKYTTMSLNDVYEIGVKHALKILSENGVNTSNENLEIGVQEIKPVQLEVGFEGHFPVERRGIGQQLGVNNVEMNILFEGNGFVLTGWAKTSGNEGVVTLEMQVDANPPETITMPTKFQSRKHDLGWKYKLLEGKHIVNLKIVNPENDLWVDVGDILVYSSGKVENAWKSHN